MDKRSDHRPRPRQRRRTFAWAALAGVLIACMVALVATPSRTQQAPGAMSRIAIVRGGAALASPLKPVAIAEAHAPGDVALCGGGWLPAPRPASAGTDGESAAPDAAAATAARFMNDSLLHAELTARLRASPRELARATALVVEMTGVDRPLGPHGERPEVDPAPAREALAAMAVSTADPKVYALAFKFCRGAANEGTCRQIDAAQWARLDPGNAAPWFELLQAAAQPAPARDPAAVDEALHRIGTSARSDFGFFTTVGELLRAAPDDEASLLAVEQLAIGLTGVEAAMPLPAYQDVSKACTGDALRDANRAQSCAAVAELLTRRSDTLIERSMGAGLARRLGWPPERTERLGAAMLAWQFSRAGTADDAGPGCPAIRRRLEHLQVTASLGEVGAMEQWIAQTGRTDADLKRDVQRWQAEFAALAASAASAGR